MKREQAYKFEKRFLKKIKKLETNCWKWTGHRTADGYGVMYTKSGNMFAHRMSYLIYKGEIPRGIFLSHTCQKRYCVNPDHLIFKNEIPKVETYKHTCALEVLRIRIPFELGKRFRVLCTQNDLSVSKQTSELVRHFVEVQELNEKIKLSIDSI